MRLITYLLLSANLVLAVLVALDVRKGSSNPVYSQVEGVAGIRLLNDGHEEGVEGDICWLFGPMSERDQANRLKSRLAEVDYFSSVVETSLEKAPGYWVYFGPIETYEQSLAQLREFQAKSIDSFIIAKGRLKGSISLGVFDNIDSAKRMMVIMSRRGYAVKMADIPRQRTEFWVSLKYPVQSPLQERFERYLSQQKGTLEGRQIFCK